VVLEEGVRVAVGLDYRVGMWEEFTLPDKRFIILTLLFEYRIIDDFDNVDLAASPSPGRIVLGEFTPV
jgi:hypothetical protein